MANRCSPKTPAPGTERTSAQHQLLLSITSPSNDIRVPISLNVWVVSPQLIMYSQTRPTRQALVLVLGAGTKLRYPN